MKTKGFTLIELLIVTVIIGILSTLGVPVFEERKMNANDAWAQAVIANTSKILIADEVSDGSTPNFADLDGDNDFSGTDDPVTPADIQARLDNQSYALPDNNRDYCFLYGYESGGHSNDNILVITNKFGSDDNGGQNVSYTGTTWSINEAANITAIDCTPGTEGVTGGTWNNFQWLNMLP